MYVITQTIDGSKYVGKALNPYKRWIAHQRAALKGYISLSHFYAALRLHGIDCFELNIDSAHQTENDAFSRERELIAQLRQEGVNVYNISAGGRGGIKYTAEQRLSHSERQRQWSQTPEARARNSAAQSQPNVRERKRLASRQAWNENEAYRKEQLLRIRSKENVEFHSTRQKAAWENPETRKRLLDGMHRPDVVLARKQRLSHEGNPKAKLTWDVVDQIREQHLNGRTMKELMIMFPQVSYGTLRRVITNRCWIKL